MDERQRSEFAESEALHLDAYIESLLAGGAHPPDAEAAGLSDAGLARAARVLDRGLVRFHPSFRFEEELGRRLRAEARRVPAPGGSAEPIPFPGVPPGDSPARGDGDPGRFGWVVRDRRLAAARRLAGEGGANARRDASTGRVASAGRGLLLGGAIASGVSLAGAAVVAWRRARPSSSALGRAARAAHEAQRTRRRARTAAGDRVV